MIHEYALTQVLRRFGQLMHRLGQRYVQLSIEHTSLAVTLWEEGEKQVTIQTPLINFPLLLGKGQG